MKNKLFLFAASLVFAVSCKKSTDALPTQDAGIAAVAQANVPPAVVSSFTSSFPGASQVEWFSVSSTTSSSSREFEVEFSHSNQRHCTRYDNSGNQRRHNVSSSTPVPAVVLAAFRSTHPNDIVYEWKLRSDGNWRAHFMRGTVKWETTYTAAGVFVKEESY